MALRQVAKKVCDLNKFQAFLSNPILKEGYPTIFTPSLDLVRGLRKGTTERPSYHPPRRVAQGLYAKELTPRNIKFLQEVVHDRYAPENQKSPLQEEPWPRNPWTYKTRRTGVIAIKIGAVPQWKKDGTKFYTTMYQVVDNHVINYVPPEEFCQAEEGNFRSHYKGLGSQVVGTLSCDPSGYTASYCGLFKKAGVPPKRKLTRFLITPDAAIQPGTPLNATHFRVGDYIDVQAKTIGHGFQGVVKRHGFKGGPATHGTTKWHRRPGSIGSGRTASRVRKGKKMPGKMGMNWRVLRGLKIWRINTRYNVLYVQGPMTPGPTHCYTRIHDSSFIHSRQHLAANPPFMPTYYPDQDGPVEGLGEAGIPDDVCHPDLFILNQPSIVYEETVAAAGGAKKKGAVSGKR